MKPIKMLSIGNSFTEDAYTYMAELLLKMGVKEFKICYLYVGGTSLEDHYNFLTKNEGFYSYRKYINGKFEVYENYRFKDAIKEDSWDIITVQQVSGLSGVKESYKKHLDPLLKEIDKHTISNQTKYYFHMTWAYCKNSDHEAFNLYNKNQETMYKKIVEAAKDEALSHEMIERIIPSGTMIQNLRKTKIKDKVCRDGFHLNKLGRYAVALIWIRCVFGLNISNIKFKTSSFKVNRKLELLKKAANATFARPYKITNI